MEKSSGKSKYNRRRLKDAKIHATELKQSLTSQPSATFLAFDTETYERDHEKLLEIGFVKFKLRKRGQPKYYHYIITDNKDFTNGKHVPDNRRNFRFGTSKYLSLKEATNRFELHVEGADYLVVHGGREDKKFLAKHDIFIQDKAIFDTQVLAMALLPLDLKPRGLKRMMDELDIDYDESILHNGGNDAAYTMKAFSALARKAKVCNF